MDEEELHSKISETPVASEENFQHRDPATWPKITDKIRCFLIEHGPEQDIREFFPNTLCDFDNRMRHTHTHTYIYYLPVSFQYNINIYIYIVLEGDWKVVTEYMNYASAISEKMT